MFRRSIRLYVLERHKHEMALYNIDKSQWYHILNENFLTEELRSKFFQCHLDAETQKFIDSCYQQSNSLLRSIMICFLRFILKFFMSSTSICGFLNCGSMFVFSDEQLRRFVFDSIDQDRLSKKFDRYLSIKNYENNSSQSYGTLLDIGAGDGNVTSKLARYFQKTYVTELSRIMQSRLMERGFQLLDVDKWYQSKIITPNPESGYHCCIPLHHFDMISCLNVLDRCDRPLEMLERIRKCLLQSGGYLLLAVVLPLFQYVEYKRSHQPEQNLSICGQTFEQQVTGMLENVFKPSGFELVRWTKLPYLSEGNLDLTYFWLIDSVFLLKPTITTDQTLSKNETKNSIY